MLFYQYDVLKGPVLYFVRLDRSLFGSFRPELCYHGVVEVPLICLKVF